MASLQIDFLTGFNDTQGNIKIDDAEVDSFLLSTDYAIGLAKSVRYRLNDSPISLTLEFPTLDQFSNLNIKSKDDVYIRVNLDDNIQIKTEISSTPTTYF